MLNSNHERKKTLEKNIKKTFKTWKNILKHSSSGNVKWCNFHLFETTQQIMHNKIVLKINKMLRNLKRDQIENVNTLFTSAMLITHTNIIFII